MNIIKELRALHEVFWCNPHYGRTDVELKKLPFGMKDVDDAEERLRRFAPYLAKVFPETAPSNGLIESPLREIENMRSYLAKEHTASETGRLFLKCDSHLPIAGSIKARGGIYTVLKHAEALAIEAGLLSISENYEKLADSSFYRFFSTYKIAVGSTGNLGLSIGIMSAKLGFQVTVHMSSDAKQWKKDLLRSKGVTVIEYASDYSKAVTEGRKLSNQDPASFFVDDENSIDLFLGYAVAAKRLQKQLAENNIVVDENHPLFLYLPCGVGGAPGGITFGAKLLWGDHVHCFFAEPTHAPCMLVGMATGMHDKISVQDLCIDNITAADGLAVGRASGFIGKTLEHLISGYYTLEDQILFDLLRKMTDLEGISLEPSALAGVPGMIRLMNSEDGVEYLQWNHLGSRLSSGTHIAWATGGSMVPEDIMKSYYEKGARS